MARNTIALDPRLSLRAAVSFALAAGDIAMTDTYGEVFPLKAGHPIAVSDTAAVQPNYASQTIPGAPQARQSDALIDGQFIYLVSLVAAASGSVVKYDLLARKVVGSIAIPTSVTYPFGSVCKVNANVFVAAYKSGSSAAYLIAFNPNTMTQYGSALSLASYQQDSYCDIVYCKVGGNDAVAVASTSATGAFVVTFYKVDAVTGSIAGGILQTTTGVTAGAPIGGGGYDCKLYLSSDGTKLMYCTQSNLGNSKFSIIDIASNAVTIKDAAAGCAVNGMGAAGVAAVQVANGVMFLVPGLSSFQTRLIGFDGSITVANYTPAAVPNSAGQTVMSGALAQYNGNWYLVWLAVNTAAGGSTTSIVMDCLSASFVPVSRVSTSDTVSGNQAANLFYFAINDRGYGVYFYFTNANGASNPLFGMFNVKNMTSMIVPRISGMSLAAAKFMQNKTIFYNGRLTTFSTETNSVVEWYPTSISILGVAISSAQPGQPFYNLESGAVNVPAPFIAQEPGTYNTKTGVTPVGKQLVITSTGKVTVS